MTFEYSPAEVRKVKRVQFGILSPDEIRAMSVCEILSPQTFENRIPKELGVMDPRMGTVDRNYRCKTCSGTRESCPGHFGHIELARPCYHVGFLTITLRVLRCVCFHCSRLLCAESNKKKNGAFKAALKEEKPRKRLMAIYRLCEKKKYCGSGDKIDGDDDNAQKDDDEDEYETDTKVFHSGCGNAQPKYRKGAGVTIEIEFPENSGGDMMGRGGEDRKQFLSARTVYQIFSRISAEDCQVLGFSHKFSRPDWLLISVVPVSPPAVRPFVLMDGMRPSQDDLTHKVYDIMKTNNALKRQEARGVPEHVLSELVELLQFHVTTMIDNEVGGQPQAKQKSGKPIKSLRERLVGKSGRVRGNLMGKRCDFSARTVIGGDPNLSIDQVGVPRSIALNLTYPERVTAFNLHFMKQLVENGPMTHPGAKTIIRDDGKQIDLRYIGRTSDMNLEPGYIVERHIMNGDIVLFNRQPSLHKMSMMAHHVKILPWSTFRINLSVTSPYNADFDGDEMNLHVPQSENSRAELIELCKVPTQIITPQRNAPVMGIVQDALLGCTKFTKRDCFFEKPQLYNLLMHIGSGWDGQIPIPCILKPVPLWTGKQVLSMIIPKVNLIRSANGRPDSGDGDNPHYMSNTDTVVRIEQGDLICGIVDKKTIGAKAQSLIHVIFNEHGAKCCMGFINQINKLICAFLLIFSSSIGVGDTIAAPSTLQTISAQINNAKQEVSTYIKKARLGKLTRQPGSTLIDTFEGKVNEILNKAMSKAGKSVKNSLHKMNNIKQMVDAGSKGNAINISQIIACVGQQNVMGKRIPYGFSNRTLPHFNKGDLGPEARGFVANSYLQGLTPQETFFHAMGGREGLVDTAVKTASTGYIQRRLIKAMEDVMAVYDRTVRNSLGHIVQFLYGEDGLDAVHIEKQTIAHVLISNNEFRKMYEFDLLSGNWGNHGDPFLDPLVKEKIRNDHLNQITLRQELQQLKQDRAWFREMIFPIVGNCAQVYLPVNIRRLIWNAQKEFGIKEDVMSNAGGAHSKYSHEPMSGSKKIYSELNPVAVVKEVQKLCVSIRILPKHAENVDEEADRNATMLIKCLIRSSLASKRVCNEHKMTHSAFKFVIGEILARFEAAIVSPGEVVGTIAAQSIGEPATQMTLNTFHFAGVSAKNVTLGVPRLAELINVAQNIKTPSLTIYLQPKIALDQELSKEVLNKLEFCTLKDIVAKTQIFYDPTPRESVVEEDREFLEYFFDFPDADMHRFMERASPWMLRLVLDRTKKEDKRIKNAYIAEKINEIWKDDLKCLFSNDNAEELVLQIRLMNGSGYDDEREENPDDPQDGEDTFLRRLEEKLLNEVELRGIKGIHKVFMRQEDQGQWDSSNGHWAAKASKEWVLDTEGSALLEVMAVEEVDDRRTTSNHIIDIFKILGIEAARQALMNEVRNVISFDGSYVNFRHLSILVDTMTSGGHLMSITRHGINRRETGPIMRSSFEQTVDILLEAAHFAMPDDLLGCSENILLGQLCPIGTGAFDLLLDEKMLEQYAIEVSSYDDPAWSGLQEGGLSPSDVTPLWYESSPNSLYGIKSPGGQSPFSSPAGSPMSMASPMFSPVHGSSSPLADMGGGHAEHSDLSSSDYSSSSSSSDSDFSSSSSSYGSQGSVTSPNYSPTSPNYSPTSPNYSPTSPTYSPTSPTYSPTSPTYSPTSPTYSPTSPTYSPTSPTYSPTSPTYSPTSPTYSPTSPTYSPTSPTYSPTSPTYSPTSPTYSPTSPTYSPTSPTYSPTSPTYSPTSPTYSPTSPTYSPTSPTYSPTSPTYSPTSPTYSPTSPQYSPTSPQYSPQHGHSPTSPTSPSSPISPSSPMSPTSPTSPTSPNSPTSPTSPGSPSSHYSSPDSNYESTPDLYYETTFSEQNTDLTYESPGGSSSDPSSSSPDPNRRVVDDLLGISNDNYLPSHETDLSSNESADDSSTIASPDNVSGPSINYDDEVMPSPASDAVGDGTYSPFATE